MSGRKSAAEWLKSILRRVFGGGDEHWVRHVMNQTTAKWIGELDTPSMDVLEISGRGWRKLPCKSYRSADYPEFDVCEGILPERFDLIISEQVFEHLRYPYRAGRHVYQMLKPGGYFLITTPFLIKIHECPIDCTRWTETGMKYFLEECGFDLAAIRTGSWGNKRCVLANFRKFWGYWGVLHSLRNDPSFPASVWALARKQE
ncbi:MAG: methyltransferase domain-containing protein [Kiritimatiellae bacterium]|nr:methyltransferase domain-containing protein [Kiritimatiellia bacterium]